MEICVLYQCKWGKELFYPESEDAKFLTEFTGRPTLLKRQLALAVKKGWKVKIVHKNFEVDQLFENEVAI